MNFAPCLKSADQVGCSVQTKILQRRRSETRTETLVAHHNYSHVVAGHLNDVVFARRVESPLKKIAVDHNAPGISPSRTRCSTGRMSTTIAPLACSLANDSGVKRTNRARASAKTLSIVLPTNQHYNGEWDSSMQTVLSDMAK